MCATPLSTTDSISSLFLVVLLRIHNVFIIQKMKKCEVDFKKVGCSSKTGKPEIFSMIAKISLGLRKFRNHSEIFASLAKFTVPSENYQFRYLTKILLG